MYLHIEDAVKTRSEMSVGYTRFPIIGLIEWPSDLNPVKFSMNLPGGQLERRKHNKH